MNVKALVCVGLLLAAPVLADAPAAPLKLHFFNVKIEWSGTDGEELPTWISGELHIGADGKPAGRIVEVALSDDGNDEDGDPAGFDSWVFDSADGGLTDLTLEADKVSFSAHDPADKDWSLHLAAHRGDSVAGTWVLQALSQTKGLASVGKNRFPLVSEQKDGELQVYPDPGEGDPAAGVSL